MARWNSRLSGIFAAFAWCAVHSSASAPQSIGAITRSPGRKRVTSAPTSVTMPAASVPGTNGRGGLRWYLPWTTRLVAKLIPAARVAMRICFGPSSGGGISSSSSFSKGIHSRTSTPRISSSSVLDCRLARQQHYLADRLAREDRVHRLLELLEREAMRDDGIELALAHPVEHPGETRFHPVLVVLPEMRPEEPDHGDVLHQQDVGRDLRHRSTREADDEDTAFRR